jgi:hypothetical protein
MTLVLSIYSGLTKPITKVIVILVPEEVATLMKKTILILSLLVCWSAALQAGACTSGFLSDYDGAGFSCTYQGITYSDFTYTPAASGGAIAPPDSGVSVTPTTIGGESGFLFTAGWLVGGGQIDDSFITFTASCTPACITDVALQMVGGEGEGGSASIAETANGLSLFADTSDEQPTPLTFSPTGNVDVRKDIGLSGGVSGAAHISAVYNLFSTSITTMTPEPSLAFLCSGFLCLLPVVRRKMRRL